MGKKLLALLAILLVISVVWSLVITLLISHSLILAWLSFFVGMVINSVAILSLLDSRIDF